MATECTLSAYHAPTVIAGDSYREHGEHIELKELKLEAVAEAVDKDEEEVEEYDLFDFHPPSLVIYIVLLIICSIPSALYIFLFSEVGFGFTYFYYLSKEFGDYWYTVGSGILGLFTILYLLDFSSWGNRSPVGQMWLFVSWVILCSGVVFLLLIMTQDYPYGPICIFAVLTPLLLAGMKLLCFKNMGIKLYVVWLSRPLFMISIITCFCWVLWVLSDDDREFNMNNRLKDASKVGCEPNFESYPACHDGEELCFIIKGEVTFPFPSGCDISCGEVYDECLNTFIVWSGPLLMSVLYFFMSFFTHFLRADVLEDQIKNFFRLWIILLATMWCAASLVGAGEGISSAIAAFTFTSFVGSFIFLGATLSRNQQKEAVTEYVANLVEAYEGYLDVIKGLFIITCLPLVFFYIAVSFVNQCMRKIGCPCNKRKVTTGWLTNATSRQLKHYRTWNHTQVFAYAILWGIGFMTMSVVVSQLTTLFLSWVIEEVKVFSIIQTTLITSAIGIVMFLLPPVPGIPIYLTLGIVMVAPGRETFGSIKVTVVYCIFVGLILKLMACTLQQKAIGEQSAGSVTVRQMCAINSHLIRTMRLILSQKGFNAAKVAILIGGPDWPTSVLCGILKLQLFQILVGTLPIVFIIAPTVLSGSLLYMSNMKIKESGALEFPWAQTAYTIMMAFTAVVQFGSSLLAMYYIEKVSTEQAVDLAQIPFDLEVKSADESEERIRKVTVEIAKWEVLPVFAKVLLLSSLVLMLICCYAVQFYYSFCFYPYELTNTIDENLGGDWTALFLPLGKFAMLLFLISCVLLVVFRRWAYMCAKKRMAVIHS